MTMWNFFRSLIVNSKWNSSKQRHMLPVPQSQSPLSALSVLTLIMSTIHCLWLMLPILRLLSLQSLLWLALILNLWTYLLTASFVMSRVSVHQSFDWITSQSSVSQEALPECLKRCVLMKILNYRRKKSARARRTKYLPVFTSTSAHISQLSHSHSESPSGLSHHSSLSKKLALKCVETGLSPFNSLYFSLPSS